jgi:hypothetical protein
MDDKLKKEIITRADEVLSKMTSPQVQRAKQKDKVFTKRLNQAKENKN